LPMGNTYLPDGIVWVQQGGGQDAPAAPRNEANRHLRESDLEVIRLADVGADDSRELQRLRCEARSARRQARKRHRKPKRARMAYHQRLACNR
jgi:hypothetical protein